jgi:hypothetical protein
MCFTGWEKTLTFEGYELQLVHKCLQTGPALAAEGTISTPLVHFPGVVQEGNSG